MLLPSQFPSRGVLTRHDGDGLERPEHPEGSESCQVAQLDIELAKFYDQSDITRCYDHEVQPVPRVPQVSVLVENEALGHSLDHHLGRVDSQKHIPESKGSSRVSSCYNVHKNASITSGGVYWPILNKKYSIKNYIS